MIYYAISRCVRENNLNKYFINITNLSMNFSNSLIIHKFDSQLKMAKFVTCMSFDTQWKHRWKPHVFWITYQNHAQFSSVFSLDIKISGSKQNKLNTKTILSTNFEYWKPCIQNFCSRAACQVLKTSTAYLSLYCVLLGLDCTSKESSSYTLLGGQNRQDSSSS